MELTSGFEPPTSSLPRKCSTPELGEHYLALGAGNENRTRLIGLEGQGNTNIRYPQNLLFMVEREGFEPSKPEATDLQSAYFNHS